MYWCFHLSFAAVLRHQLSPYVNQVSPYKPQECRTCEPHLATRHVSRNTEGRPCNPQQGHSGETMPAFKPQENCVHNTSVALKAAARAQAPSSLISLLPRYQLCQRRIGLVKIERACQGAAWSTHLTDVDNHVCATTPDAKLIELLHFMPCPAGRELCGSCVTLCHKLSCCVVHWPVESIQDLNTSPETLGGVLRCLKTRHRTHLTLNHVVPFLGAICSSTTEHCSH